MEHKDYFYLGYLSKTIGHKGEISAQIESDNPFVYESLPMIFIEISETLIPYQVESFIIKGGKAHIKLEDVDDTEKGQFLCGNSIFLPLSLLPKLKGNNFYYHEIIGFEVEDKKYGKIGLVKEVIDQSSQAIFQIDFNGKEILIPINDDIIKKVDRKKQLIKVDSPEGLIELYLE